MRIQLMFLGLSALFVFTKQDDDEAFCNSREGTPGVCINIKTQLKSCTPLLHLLKMRDWDNLRKNICSADNTRVCCPMVEYNETIVYDPEPNYRDHPSFELLPLKNCGLSYSSSDRIIGGNASKPGEFPFVVRLGVQLETDGPTQFICGGSLISKRFVLTAAHCFNSHVRLSEIVLGQTNEDKEEECIETADEKGVRKNACAKPVRVGYERIFIHPGYRKSVGSKDDIALIRLNKDIDIESDFTRPICLPFLTEYRIAGKLGDTRIRRENNTMVAGWGKTNNAEIVGSTTLQYVRVPIQPNIFCRVTYRSFNVSNSQICAGGVKHQDSCLGDSGGPLFLHANPGKGSSSRALRAFQLGIVSYGKTKCGKGNEPVVYTRVRSYLSWILDKMSES